MQVFCVSSRTFSARVRNIKQIIMTRADPASILLMSKSINSQLSSFREIPIQEKLKVNHQNLHFFPKLDIFIEIIEEFYCSRIKKI